MSNFKLFKVFNAEVFDDEIWDYLMDRYDFPGNDIYKKWKVKKPEMLANCEDEVDQYLLDNGAEIGEEILLEFSW